MEIVGGKKGVSGQVDTREATSYLGDREVGGRVKTGVQDDGDRWRCRDVTAFLEAWTQHVRKVRQRSD